MVMSDDRKMSVLESNTVVEEIGMDVSHSLV